eukprot:540604_1
MLAIEEKKQSTDVNTFPKNIELPSEIMEYNNTYGVNNDDLKVEKYLYEKYKHEINSFKIFPDDVLIRFVIGYRYISELDKRLTETVQLFENFIKFHKQYDFDNIFNTTHINNVPISEYLHGSYIYGQDKFGHPLFFDEGLKYESTADVTIHKNCGEKGMDQVMCYLSRLCYEIKLNTSRYYNLLSNNKDDNEAKNDSSKSKFGVYKHCLILDMKNFSVTRTLKDRWIHEYYARQFTALCPEMLHKMYVINAPWVFQSVWKIVTTFLHPNTVAKTKILGYDYLDELLKEIDIHMIPKKFGGKGKWEVVYGSVPKDYPIQLISKK